MKQCSSAVWFALLLVASSACGEELRGRLASWDGGTGLGEFTIISGGRRIAIGYYEPLPRWRLDSKGRIELGTWVSVDTRAREPGEDGPALWAKRLAVEAEAEPWLAALRDAMDPWMVAFFVRGESAFPAPAHRDLLASFARERVPGQIPEMVRNLRGWILEAVGERTIDVLTAPGLSRSAEALSLRLRLDGDHVFLDRIERVGGDRFFGAGDEFRTTARGTIFPEPRIESEVRACCAVARVQLEANQFHPTALGNLPALLRERFPGRRLIYASVQPAGVRDFARRRIADAASYTRWITSFPRHLESLAGPRAEIVIADRIARITIAGRPPYFQWQDDASAEARVVAESLVYLHLNPRVHLGGTPVGGAVFLKGGDSADFDGALAALSSLGVEKSIDVVWRTDTCFGIDGRYPDAHPFATDVGDCPDGSEHLTPTRRCSLFNGEFGCRTRAYPPRFSP